MLRIMITTVCLLLGASLIDGQGIDLSERYPATLEYSETGLGWTSEPEDVFELSSFEFDQGSGFKLAGKRATLVLGRNGTNVLWAALYPDKPVELESPLAGDGEHASELFLRFAPKDLGRVFPARTVEGPGDAAKRARAVRLFQGKIGWRWCTPSGNTTVVPRGILLVDFDSDEGTRRLFALDRNAGRVTYVDEFEAQLLPELTPIESKAALRAFDYVWESFDAEYAKFERHPELDWKKHAKPFRARAKDAATTLDLGAVIADMLRVLEDLHVWVRVDAAFMPGYTRTRTLNASFSGSNKVLGGVEKSGPNLWVARTDDGIGYLNVHGLSDVELPARVDAALDQLADTWSLVVDLRFNGGGDELLARQIAGRFVEREVVYSQNRFRTGKRHDALGPVFDRIVAPRELWRYESPVVVLQGPVTLSSAESFALMMAQAPNVTTLGSNTGGSSGNPRALELECGITVNLPRWIDLDPAGRPLEGVGVEPDERREFPQVEYTNDNDPLLASVLRELRTGSVDARRAGRR